MSQINFQARHRKPSGAVMKRFITLAAVVRLTRESGADTFTVKQIKDKIKDLESVNPEMVNKDSTVEISITARCCVNANNTGKPNKWKDDMRYPFYYWVNPGTNDGLYRLYDPLNNPEIDPSW